MTLDKQKAAERRYTILALMVEAAGRASESEILTGLEVCDGGFEYGLTDAVVRDDLAWLRQRNLITTEMLMDTMMIAQITRTGILAVQDRLAVDGLLKPLPQE